MTEQSDPSDPSPDIGSPPGTCQPGVCPDCGLRIHTHPLATGGYVALLTREVPAELIPERHRYTLINGIAYPGTIERDYGLCRLAHAPVCPRADQPTEKALASVWRTHGIARQKLLRLRGQDEGAA